MGSIRKTKKKNIPKTVHEMSKEMLEETLKKKKECNAKALFTVEKLCEANVEEEWLLNNLQFINQCHFDDVVVERAITKVCGYPLCNEKLDKVPSQQYHISTRYNKVFDITDRKNFCCSACYKSATYVKKQLFTSPLWFRDQEVIPKYTVLRETKSSVGEEIVFNPDKINLEKGNMKKLNSVNKTRNISINANEAEEKCQNLKLEDPKSDEIYINELKIIENTELCENKFAENNCIKKISASEGEKHENIQLNSEDKDKACEKSNESKAKKLNETKVSIKIKEEPVNIVTKVEKYFFEWCSFDTLIYLFGKEKLKEMFQDKAIKIKEIINSKLSGTEYNEKIEKIIKLYGLFDMNSLTKNEIKTNLKPLPDYSVLKEEGKTLEVKVRAFYQGQLEVKSAEQEGKKKEEEMTDSDNIYLPLIDAHAQTALRRKIVLDKLNKVLPEVIRIFSSSYVLEMNEVRHLVSTFTLNAHNIVFKPREWYLVGFIVIKLLCIKDKQLQLLMNSQTAKSQVTLILSSYQLKDEYLDDLLCRLTDGSNMIKKLSDINK